MRANKNSTQMPISWTYGIIWAVIMAVGAVALRYILWYNLVWMGDVDVFSDKFCSNSITLLCIGAVIGVVMYLWSYARCKGIAASNIMDLHGVAHGVYGKFWTVPLPVGIILEVVWTVICMIILVIVCELNIALSADDLTVVITFAAINGVGLIVDMGLFALGNAFFMPKEVMEKK